MPSRKEKPIEELERLLPGTMRRVFILGPDPTLLELPMAQMRLLRLLQEQSSLRVSQLAVELGTTPSAVTQMCHRLSTAGFLERMEDADDGRGKRILLSEKGKHMLETRKQQRKKAGMEALKEVPIQDIEAAVVALRRLMEAAPLRSDAEPIELVEAVEPHTRMA